MSCHFTLDLKLNTATVKRKKRKVLYKTCAW